MNLLKSSLGILFPAIVIVGTVFLNVVNAHLLLLVWVLFSVWKGQSNSSLISAQMLAMLLLSVWITLAQFWSDVGSIGWFTTWAILAIPLAFVGWQHYSRAFPVNWSSMLSFLGLLGSFVAVWGIFQVTVLGYSRAVGPLSDPNTYGCLLNLLWFPLFTRFLSLKNEEKAIKLYGFGFILLSIQMALTMSGSRTASMIWLVLFVLIVLFRWKSVARIRLVYVGIIATTAFLIYSLYSNHLAVSSYEAIVTNPHVTQAADSPRFLMWQSTLKMWLNAPWLGEGLGSWNYLYPAYRNANEAGTSGYYAHNDYLQFLQEGGVLLFIGMIGICGWSYLNGIRKVATAYGSEGIERIGILAGIAAVALHATVNFSFYLIYINILVGIYLSQLNNPTQPTIQQTNKNSTKLLSKVSIATILIVITVNGFNAILSSASLSLFREESIGWQTIHIFIPRVSPLSLATLLASIRPSDTNAQRYITASLENAVINNPKITSQQANRVYDEIINGYELMRSQNKYDASTPANEAGFIIGFGKRYGVESNQLLRARELLQESLQRDPSRVDSAILLGETYSMEGKVQVTYDILNGMIPRVWRSRDKMIIEAEILKLKDPRNINQLSALQQELREMKINCGIWECGERYAQIEKSARKTLDYIEKNK